MIVPATGTAVSFVSLVGRLTRLVRSDSPDVVSRAVALSGGGTTEIAWPSSPHTQSSGPWISALRECWS